MDVEDGGQLDDNDDDASIIFSSSTFVYKAWSIG